MVITMTITMTMKMTMTMKITILIIHTIRLDPVSTIAVHPPSQPRE